MKNYINGLVENLSQKFASCLRSKGNFADQVFIYNGNYDY